MQKPPDMTKDRLTWFSDWYLRDECYTKMLADCPPFTRSGNRKLYSIESPALYINLDLLCDREIRFFERECFGKGVAYSMAIGYLK
jgi:hypothetical protein